MNDVSMTFDRSFSVLDGDFSMDDSKTPERSTEGDGTTVSPGNDEAENQYFGRRENCNVHKLKHLVFLALFLLTLAVCLVIFFIIRRGQRQEFEASYVGHCSYSTRTMNEIQRTHTFLFFVLQIRGISS